MNWFTSYYNSQMNTLGWLSDLNVSMPIQVLLFSVIVTGGLLYLRSLTSPLFYLSSGLTAIVMFLDPKPTLEFLHTGTRIDSLSFDTCIVVLGMVLGTTTLVLCIWRKFRTVDRLMFAVSLTVASYLICGYHILLINGMLRYELKQQESHLIDVARINDQAFGPTCKALKLDCRTGKRPERLEYALNADLEKQANDHLAYYRKNYRPPMLFSDSNALISTDYPYAYAYIERNTDYRWVIDTTTPARIAKSYQYAFTLICHVIVFFWLAATLIGLYLHNVIFFLKSEKHARNVV
ncbi:hypothetical protein ACI2KR_08625 [Pseudomonas luteola]